MAGKKTKTRKISFGNNASPRKINLRLPRITGVLKVLVIVCVLAAIGAAFYFTQKYVKSNKPAETGPLILEDAPEWVNTELKTKIFAEAGYKYIKLDENAAQLIAENLASTGWIDEIQVQTTHDSIIIKGRWRKPLALVKSGPYHGLPARDTTARMAVVRFYVDAESVVLDFVPLPNLPIIQVRGISVTSTPPAGQVFERDDLAAAVTILAALAKMDESVTPDKPLMSEIDGIDVSNFKGRHNSSQPHIILYAKDNTEIIWGAEFGAWQQHLEATDEEKLAKLYGYYKEYGSLLGGAKYINLRDPQDNIPLPIDKY